MTDEQPLLKGTYEDFIALIVRHEQRILARGHHVLPHKPEWQRLAIEVPVNLLGTALAGIFKLLPPKVAYGFFLKMLDTISNNKYQSHGIEISKSCENAEILYKYVSSSYSEPSILTITSHAPVIGEVRDLNLGLMAAGFRLMSKVRGKAKPFRIFLAVDVMALDTLSVLDEAAYAGVMGSYHIGTDRWPSKRHTIQPMIFGGVSYASAARRLGAALRAKHNVVLVQSGGVKETARLLYATREFVWELRRRSEKKPWKVLEALKPSLSFISFLNHVSAGGSAWRKIEAYLIARLGRDPLAFISEEELSDVSRQSSVPSETGLLAEEDLAVLRAVIACFGLDAQGSDLLADFREEFARITPYRIRFFEFLLKAVVRRGTPILLQPLDHSQDLRQPILLRPPVALVPGGDRTVRLVEIQDGTPTEKPLHGSSFFRDWGTRTFLC